MGENVSPALPRIRVAAIIRQEGKVLLVRHQKDGQTYWLLPGGGVEWGETLSEALAREIKEETGLVIRSGELCVVNDSIAPEGRRHVVNLCFDAHVCGGELTLGSDPRLAELAFCSAAQVLDLVIYPDLRETLVSILERGRPTVPIYLGNLWRD